MTTLHTQLLAKLAERPETVCASGTWLSGLDGKECPICSCDNLDSGHPSLSQHLAAGDRQIYITYSAGLNGQQPAPHGDFVVAECYEGSGEPLGRWSFWARPGGETGRWPEGGGERLAEAIPEALAAGVLAAHPIPFWDSMWGWAPEPGAPLTAIGYWHQPGEGQWNPLQQLRFSLNGEDAPGFTTDLAAWWGEVDAGRLRSLDSDLADGRLTLSLAPDGAGFFKFIRDHDGGTSEYLVDVPLPGGPIQESDIPQGDPSIMRKTAACCLDQRAAAAAAMAAAR